jgi:Flp pilus assembly protein CpaB
MPGLVELPVPTRDIAPGQPIELDDLLWLAFPQDYVPEKGVITSAEPIVGRVPTELLLKSEFIRAERLAAAPLGQPLPADAQPNLSITFSPLQQGVKQALRDLSGEPQPTLDTVMVIVAARDLPMGHLIEEEDLYAVQIEPRYLSEGVFLSPVHVVGRNVCQRIVANEFVRAERLWDPEGPCTQGGPASAPR